MILPEDVIHNYQFEIKQPSIDELKTFLINHYNTLTLRKYKESNEFLTEQEIILKLPNLIIEFYSNKPIPTPQTTLTVNKTKGGFWLDDSNNLNQFTNFIQTHYEPVDSPTTKFKDLMCAFTKETGIESTSMWSSKYEAICDQLAIKYEKVVDPRFINKGGNGTCFVFLKSIKTTVPVVVNKKYEGLIPQIPNVEKQSTIPVIPRIKKND
jgi:hypothetical protein